MEANITTSLIAHLTAAQAIEEQSLRLFGKGVELADDEQIRGIYRDHYRQTEEHARFLTERLAALQAGNALPGASADELGKIELRLPARAGPAALAVAAYAFENLEIAAYHLLLGIAKRAGDTETAAAVEHILEQEEAAAEALASTLDRTFETSVDEAGKVRERELQT